MSVHPGFSGQKFIPEVLEKIPALRGAMREDALLEIDGGINAETAPRARDAGIDVIVAGTAVFKANDMAEAIRTLRG
jgi:ribulose-phosphate 3-epimerase